MISNNPVYESIFDQNSRRTLMVFEQEESALLPFWHYHPEIEITLITQGNGTRMIGDSIESYQNGDLVLVGENLPHHWISREFNKEKLQTAVVIQFQAGLFEGIAEFDSIHQFLLGSKLGFQFPSPSTELQERITKLIDLPQTLQISSLIEILYELAQYESARTLSNTTKFNILNSGKEQKQINDVIRHIISNQHQKLTVNQMADFSCMIPQAFCRWFRKHTGLSFITYLNKSRIEAACQILLVSDRSVKTIAYEVGFESISHFNRTFKKYIGISPLEYRKKHAGKRTMMV
ncbi:MAG: AraC family transcriptional regulator [Bacteroidota bacterium]